MIGDSGFLYAFEPDPVSRRILGQNLEANSARNVSMLHYCVLDSAGTEELSVRWFVYRLSNIRNPEQSRKRIRVETTTLDTFCEERQIRPDGIKIDVEGAETRVLRGAANILKNHAPWVLLEFHGKLMTDSEWENNWKEISANADEIIFVEGDSEILRYMESVASLPDCLNFHALIRY